MEAILHIEPITRKASVPLRIGHHDLISYGEVLTEDGENIGTPSSFMTLGCPLETPEIGSANDNCYLPLIRTVECVPDPTKDQGHIYSETLHYRDNQRNLIPYRTKIRSGSGQGLRLTHLPSLNAVRHNLTGLNKNVADPREEIVLNLLFQDPLFEKQRNLPLHDWLSEELTMFLSRYPTNEFSFIKEPIVGMIDDYVDQIRKTSSELTNNSLRDIVRSIVPPSIMIPNHYFSPNPIVRPLRQLREHGLVCPIDFSSLGTIPVDTLPRIDHNPSSFKEIAEFIDRLPLTDLNLDLVVNINNEIQLYHEHVAVNRFGFFEDNRTARYYRDELINVFDHDFINNLLGKFAYNHNAMTPQIQDIIQREPLKIKLIKTITDEALILLYRYNSREHEEALCGVYFDLALQSLSPLSIIPESVIN